MKNILLGLVIFSSASYSFAMTENCTIASTMFEDSGLIMSDGISMAINDGEKLKNSTVTYDEFSIWFNKIYPKKQANFLNKYNQYKTNDSNNPIYLGFVSIIEVDNFTASLNNYMKNKQDNDFKSMLDAKSRIENAYNKLAEDCGKKYER